MSMHLSVVIPAYNEAKRIGATLADLKRYFSKKSYTYEILVVSDGSTDDTSLVVSEWSMSMPQLRLIDNKENRGKGYAVKCGMLEATGSFKLFMDADNSVTIDTIEPFLEEMYRGGHDVMIGSIAFSYVPVIEHNGWHRRIFGSLSKLLVRIVATPGIYDTQRGFKLFTKKAANLIFPRQKIERFGFDIEILAVAQLHGLSIKELPVYWDNPAGSKVHLGAYLDSFVELTRIYANMLRGAYDAPKFRGSRRKKASTLILFLAEFPALLSRFVREVLTSKVHLDIQMFDLKTAEKKGKGLIYKGKEFIHFTDLPHNQTALYTLVQAQKVILALIALAGVAAIAIDWRTTATVLVCVVAFIYLADLAFNAYLVLRSLAKKPALRFEKSAIQSLADNQLPLYTILCPLYREWYMTPQFLSSIEDLDYPREKLEVLLLMEESDKRTQRNINSLSLPENFKKIIVPDSRPKTKSRALNCGLEIAKGEYVVVYDADDMPEPDQLRKALIAFKNSSPETVCVQARVGFYNAEENTLTKIFTAEHSLWFDLTLPGLHSLNAPMPLGGTSNHFKAKELRAVSGWDSFNVSEDWDLGIRLSKRGYRTAVIDSTTYEEATSDMKNWYRQRSRWIKGYIQTYLVHMRDPRSFKGGFRDLITFQIFVGGKILSMAANPLFWLIAGLSFLSKTQFGLSIERFVPPVVLLIGGASFVIGNVFHIVMHVVACTKKTLYGLAGRALFVPFYKAGVSAALTKALHDLYIRPHYRAKSTHVLDRKKKLALEAAKSKKAPDTIFNTQPE